MDCCQGPRHLVFLQSDGRREKPGRNAMAIISGPDPREDPDIRCAQGLMACSRCSQWTTANRRGGSSGGGTKELDLRHSRSVLSLPSLEFPRQGKSHSVHQMRSPSLPKCAKFGLKKPKSHLVPSLPSTLSSHLPSTPPLPPLFAFPSPPPQLHITSSLSYQFDTLQHYLTTLHTTTSSYIYPSSSPSF